jgi:hypothetical protein
MGRSLDELVGIGYLQTWDVRPMVTKNGFKLVLQAGRTLSHVLAISQRKSLEASAAVEAVATPSPAALGERQREAMKALISYGIAEAKAAELVRKHEAGDVLDQVEYTGDVLRRDKRGRIANPAGFLIYAIESRLPVPAYFETTRRKAEREAQSEPRRIRLEESYDEFVRVRVEEEASRRFPGAEWDKQVKRAISNQMRADRKFAAMEAGAQRAVAEQMVRQELMESVPSLEEWCASTAQLGLFGAGK